jgi:hypothetical protein
MPFYNEFLPERLVHLGHQFVFELYTVRNKMLHTFGITNLHVWLGRTNEEYEKLANKLYPKFPTEEIKIMDIGGGSGAMLHALKPSLDMRSDSWEYLGTDVMENALKLGRDVFKQPNVRFELSNIVTDTLPSNYNVILCFCVLAYCGDSHVDAFEKLIDAMPVGGFAHIGGIVTHESTYKYGKPVDVSSYESVLKSRTGYTYEYVNENEYFGLDSYDSYTKSLFIWRK